MKGRKILEQAEVGVWDLLFELGVWEEMEKGPGRTKFHQIRMKALNPNNAELFASRIAESVIAAERKRCEKICEQKMSSAHLDRLWNEGWDEKQLRGYAVACECIAEDIISGWRFEQGEER